jgi:hypothetical protein
VTSIGPLLEQCPTGAARIWISIQLESAHLRQPTVNASKEPKGYRVAGGNRSFVFYRFRQLMARSFYNLF